MKIRKATLEDLPEIMEIEKQAFIPEIQECERIFAERVSVFPEGFLMIEDSEGVAGYFCSELWNEIPENKESFLLGHSAEHSHCKEGKILYISSFALKTRCRGKGLGKDVLRNCVKTVYNSVKDVEKMVLIVNKLWISAQNIYKSLGFKPYKEVKNFFPAENGEKSDGIVMKLELNNEKKFVN